MEWVKSPQHPKIKARVKDAPTGSHLLLRVGLKGFYTLPVKLHLTGQQGRINQEDRSFLHLHSLGSQSRRVHQNLPRTSLTMAVKDQQLIKTQKQEVTSDSTPRADVRKEKVHSLWKRN